MEYKRSVFLFRRDLRLEDNTGLLRALEQSEEVIPCFIFDPRQVEDNPYRGDHCVQFMLESLEDLEEQLQQTGGRLYLFYGQNEKVLPKILKDTSAAAVFVNRDYTPFAKQRDAGLKAAATTQKAAFISCNDLLLNEPEDIKTGAGGTYTVFTPFRKRCEQEPVREPQGNSHRNYYTDTIEGARTKEVYSKVLSQRSGNLLASGGRTEAVRLLKKIRTLTDYEHSRQIPSLDGTSYLSAHHKFGTVSIRETFHTVAQTLGPDHGLISELYWRDFFTHIAWHFPRVFGQAFKKQYDKLHWSTSSDSFTAWCQGQTGFPLVDAGMRELNQTGYMHNRVRMVVASFLVKDLHHDWRKGEQYFAQQLTDYDPAVNNGNWQWAASTGCDAQPYFRIFNPWRQQERFDPECIYIKKWIPELSDLSAKEIHNWHKIGGDGFTDYPLPIIDHGPAAAKAKEMFKAAG